MASETFELMMVAYDPNGGPLDRLVRKSEVSLDPKAYASPASEASDPRKDRCSFERMLNSSSIYDSGSSNAGRRFHYLMRLPSCEGSPLSRPITCLKPLPGTESRHSDHCRCTAQEETRALEPPATPQSVYRQQKPSSAGHYLYKSRRV